MIQLLIQEYFNGPLVIDASSFISMPIAKTNKFGFATLEFSFIYDLPRIKSIFIDRKYYHVRLGTAEKVIWEGRLEEVAITDKSVDCIAYGYARAFSDLEVTDLWSDTYDPGRWHTIPHKTRFGALTDSYTFDLNEFGIKISLNKNASYVTSFGYLYYILLPGSSRGITMISSLVSGINVPVTSAQTGWQRMVPETYGAASPSPNPYFTTFLATFGPHPVVVDLLPCSGVGFFFQPSAATYVGETGDWGAGASDIRIGSTASISGSRLYADEVLRYYCSGVITLNSTQLSPDFSGIQSPLFDLRQVVYERANGLDVLEDLISRPTSTGIPFEIRVWENQKIVFKQKAYNKTWYISYSQIEVNKVTGLKYNKVRARYNDKRSEIFYHTAWYTDNNPPYRELTIDVDTIVPETAIAQAQAYLNQSDTVLQAVIRIQRVRNANQFAQSSCYVRSGDRIIITDIPYDMYDDVNDSFIVGETSYDFDTGYNEIVPEQLSPTIERILAR